MFTFDILPLNDLGLDRKTRLSISRAKMALEELEEDMKTLNISF